MRRRLALAICVAVAALAWLAPTGATPAAGVLPWYRQYPAEPGNPLAVACPSATVCYAAGTERLVMRTADGGQTWTRAHLPIPATFEVRALACSSPLHCTASADDHGPTFRTQVVTTADGGATWTRVYSTDVGGTGGLACPAPTACTLLLHFGQIVTTTDGGATWTRRELPLPTTSSIAVALACPTPGTCDVATYENRTDGYGSVLVTADGGLTWRTHVIPPGHVTNVYTGMACPTVRTCYIVQAGQVNHVLVTRDGWRSHAWRSIPIELPRIGPEPASFSDPVCPAESLCYLRSAADYLAVTPNRGVSWHLSGALDRSAPSVSPFGWPSPLPPSVQTMACPTPQRCLAVRGNGTIVRTDDGAASWAPVFTGTARTLLGLACASPSTCVAVGPDATLLRTDDGQTWTRRPYPLHGTAALAAAACHGPAICLLAGADGDVAASADTGRTWHETAITVPGLDMVILRAAACPTDRTCYAGGYAYSSTTSGPTQAVLTRTDDGGATWRRVGVPSRAHAVNAIGCALASVCLIGGGDAQDDDSYPSGFLLLTRDGGATWRNVDADAFFGITCPGGDVCEAVGQSSNRAPLALGVSTQGAVLARRQFSAQRWFRVSLNGVACSLPTRCWAVGDGGMVAYTGDGRHWSTAALGADVLTAVACSAAGPCWAVGSGSAILSTQPGSSPHPVPTATSPSASPPAPIPTPTLPRALPAPTQVPAGPGCPPRCAPGTVLYGARWRRGFDGWRTPDGGTGAWRVRGGALISPPSTAMQPVPPLLPPWQPGPHGINNYAVQFGARPGSREVSMGFHLSVRRQGRRYDDVAVSSCCTNSTSLSIMYRDERTTNQYVTEIGMSGLPLMDARWHTYRVEVRGETFRLLVDGRPLIRGLDRHLLRGGTIDLSNVEVPTMFRGFEIVAL